MRKRRGARRLGSGHEGLVGQVRQGIGGPGGEFTGGGLRCSNGGSVRRTRNLEGPRPERHRHLDFAEHERTRLGGKPQNLPRLLVLENDGAFGKNDSKAGHSDRTS